MIPSWILELVGYAAAHASDDHGATCPTHADPEAECLCGLAQAQELLANVPEAVKGVALRAEPIAYDCREGGQPLPEAIAKPIDGVAAVLNAATAMGLMPLDMTEMVIGSVVAVGLDFAEGEDRVDGILEIVEQGIRRRTLRELAMADAGTGLVIHLRMRCAVDRSELSEAAIDVLDDLEGFMSVQPAEA